MKAHGFSFYEPGFTHPTTSEVAETLDPDGTRHVITHKIIKPAILQEIEDIVPEAANFSKKLLIQNETSAYFLGCEKAVIEEDYDSYGGTFYYISIISVPLLRNPRQEETLKEINKPETGLEIRIKKDSTVMNVLYIGEVNPLLDEYYIHLTKGQNISVAHILK